jgi:hypothetical protein
MAALMTKLDAVNKMLEKAWESPVSTLTVSGLASVAMATRILEATSMSIQSTGWTFNTENDFPINRDYDERMPVPYNTLRVDTCGEHDEVDVVNRGGYLYDRKNHRFTFPDHPLLKTKIVLLLDFEDLPQSARYYIALHAARVFHDAWLARETPSAVSFEEQTAQQNMALEETETGDYNLLYSGSYSVGRILAR